MDDLVTLCLLGIFLLVGLMLLPRLLRGFGGPANGGYYGGERPEYDDPNINSRGSFGRSGGLFGGSRSRQYDDPPSAPSSPGGRVDDPNIRSRGGFGRSKK